ncbi:MAG TPA: GAF domain-containing protein [Candidatus Acidoferrum sp.]|nr:GAF domain-containing protein [Candidatus Acidoferrum sp.]
MSDELAELEQRYARLKLMYDVSHVIHSSLDPQEALQLIVDEAVRMTRASSGSVALMNPTTHFLEIQAAHGLPVKAMRLRLRVGEGITGWVARHGKTARVSDVKRDARYILLRDEVRSELAVPLEVRGEVRGVINVDSDREDAFSAADQELLEALSREAARVVHNTWLYEQLRFRARMFETLVNVGRTINSTLSLDDALQTITRESGLLMNAKTCSLVLLDSTGEWLDVRASHGAGLIYLDKPRLSVEESAIGVVIRRKKPLQIENVQTSTLYQNVSVARAEGLVSLLSVPLSFAGETIGALNIYKGEIYAFSNEEIRIVSALAELSAIAIAKARLYERIVDVEEQLRQNEKLSALGLLAAEVAHEIRNPLTVMKMLFHSLNLSFPPNDPRSKDAEIMGAKMDHLNKIVEQVLDFARSTEPHLTPANVNELIDDLALLVRHKLQNHGVEFRRQLAADLPVIMADSAQLEQAFLNLTLNAVEAMPRGGVLEITTKPVKLARRAAGPTHIAITFKDNGAGMTPEMRATAMGSLLNTTKPKGTGLGLAIVRRVVETHRGKLRIRSVPDRGTTITLVLPV